MGGQCDRTGPTKLIGGSSVPVSLDYIELANKKGDRQGPHAQVRRGGARLPGRPGRRGLRAHEGGGGGGRSSTTAPRSSMRSRRDIWRIGIRVSRRGLAAPTSRMAGRWPYIFPLAATYWSQMGGGHEVHAGDWRKEGGQRSRLCSRIIPPGGSRSSRWSGLAKQQGFTCASSRCPSRAWRWWQAPDITRRFRADWVVAHLFGRSPSVSIKELNKEGFPMDRVVSLVWGRAEVDMRPLAGTSPRVTSGLQFAGVGRQLPGN